MDIGGIGNSYLNNKPTLDTTQSKVEDDSFESKLQAAVESKDEKQLRSVCQDFEGIFLNMMYKQMKASIPKSTLIQEDFSMQTFNQMLDEELMNGAAKGRGVGLAESMYKQLSQRLKADSLSEKTSDEGDKTAENGGTSEIAKDK
jgi:flagellar protein FlgJ